MDSPGQYAGFLEDGAHKQFVGLPWVVCGQSVDSPWGVHGKFVAGVHGVTVDNPWNVRGVVVDSR